MRRKLILVLSFTLIIVLIFSSNQVHIFGCINNYIKSEELLSTLEEEAFVISEQSKMIEIPLEEKDYVSEALVNNGYQALKTQSIEGAIYQTKIYGKFNSIVTVAETSNGARITFSEFDKNARELFYCNKETEDKDIFMAQIGVARGDAIDNPMIGLCYVYKLANGSAVIIDGGLSNDECSDNLYNTLDKLDVSKDDNGRFNISAWIFTHGHIDHIGTFYSFTNKYSDEINLSYLMYDFPIGHVAPTECDVHYFKTIANKYYPKTIHVDPQAGLCYYFDNLTLKMLYTPDMIYTSDSCLDYYNNTSFIFIAECNGTKILHTGDAGEGAAKKTWESYCENSFKSDAVQISHHGLSTGADYSNDWEYLERIYDATEASIGLLPMGTQNSNEERNGRYTMLIASTDSKHQISFVTNEYDRHRLHYISQEYYDSFIESISNGKSDYNTLFGYNGINIIVNEENLITYMASSENTEMVTLFKMGRDGLRMIRNEYIKNWINQ